MTDWRPGDNGMCGGIMWRVAPGVKDPADLRLEFRINGQWVPVHMEVGFLLADFFHANEDVLFPPANGFSGGNRYLSACAAAAARGWTATAAALRLDQARKRARGGY